MKIKNLLFCTLFFCCTLGINSLKAQLVEKASITANEANFKMISPNSYLMEIAGPNNYYFKQQIEHTKNISLSNVNKDGKKFSDGTYKMQVTPIVTLSETIRLELAALRKENDQEKIAAYRLAHELPSTVNVYNISFSIRNGQFVSPDEREVNGVNLSKMASISWEQEQDHPVLYASLNDVNLEHGKPVWASNALPFATDNTSMFEDDQQFLDDVIVNGSICVGQDCNNGENFGFDTGRYKENNLRIHFDDTSNSASFPSNDWRISINDSSNGGASYFAVEDATAGNVPFRIEAGAGANALHVDASGGNIGLGTATPVVELHVVDGDSPTMRLEQNGSSGFTAQTWDLAANETNFFIRDVTNGSKLPFRIRPNAPTSSIDIAASGNVGMGTQSPDAPLDIERSSNPKLRLTNTQATTGNTWELISADNSGRLNITNVTNGITPVKIDDLANNNLLKIGLNGSPDRIDITGVLFINGIDNSNPDFVFEPDYNLESIEEHASFMWKHKHLPAVGRGVIGDDGKAMINVANRSQGVLEELEKAHLYIEQLYKRINIEKESRLEVNNKQQQTINQQAEEIANLKAQLIKMETLETQLAELIQMVSALNKTHNSSDSSDKAVGEKE